MSLHGAGPPPAYRPADLPACSPACPCRKMEARGEIEDLTTEHETEREELLDSIRNQNKELQLWEQVCMYVASFVGSTRFTSAGEVVCGQFGQQNHVATNYLLNGLKSSTQRGQSTNETK